MEEDLERLKQVSILVFLDFNATCDCRIWESHADAISIIVFLDFNGRSMLVIDLKELKPFQSLFSWISTGRWWSEGKSERNDFNPCFLGFQHLLNLPSERLFPSISILVFLDFNTRNLTQPQPQQQHFNPCFLGFQLVCVLLHLCSDAWFQSLFSWISTPHFSRFTTSLHNFNPCFLGFQLYAVEVSLLLPFL